MPLVRFLVAVAVSIVVLAAAPGFASDIAARVAGAQNQTQTLAQIQTLVRPVTIGITWGGGAAQAWAGSIDVVGVGKTPARPAFTWRVLSTRADAAAMIHELNGAIVIRQGRALAAEGVEITIADWRRARLVVRLEAVDGRQAPLAYDVAVADVVREPVQRPLDGAGNRLVIKRPAADALRIAAEGASGDERQPPAGRLWRPGDRVRLRVDPLFAVRGKSQAGVEVRLRAVRPVAGIDGQAIVLAPRAAPAGDEAPDIVSFEPVVFDVVLPGEEGVHHLEVEAVERGALGWAKPIATRTVSLVAVADRPPQVTGTVAWTTLYELDPGSPRLHERLRRMSGVSLPAVPLPTMPLPSLTRTNVPLPRLPAMPLPNVSLPNVAAMVPRLGGLLSAGDSVVVAHPLGPMLRLPPARTPGQPRWEGISVPAARPDAPHLVEIEYPSDQDAVFGITVLEADAAGGAVEVRHAGGFEARRPRYASGGPQLAVHRFVFWPTTRHPLIVIANAATDAEATFGRVRVKASATRLPAAAPSSGAERFASGVRRRPVYAFLEGANLAGRGRDGSRIESGGAAAASGMPRDVGAIVRSAEGMAADGVSGALVAVLGGGEPLWDSAALRRAGRWDGVGTAAEPREAAADFVDVLAAICAREGLSLMPTFRFDAPLPAVETELAGQAGSEGMVCVGRDGRPRPLPGGGRHYNILDPRVQAAVEEVILELAGRLRAAPGVLGFALDLPDAGWLHLPGTAWCLDDSTFARFIAANGGLENPAGAERHARRAQLVEGPFREPWLRWRCGEIGRFHARLAERLAALDERWSLAIVPTTLATGADFAGRFRPAAAPPPADAAREAGLDPAALPAAAAARVVYVAPAVHAPVADTRSRAGRQAAARALAFAGAVRRGIALVEDPLAVDVTVPASHGPFGGAAVEGPCMVRAPGGDGCDLGESLEVADAEMLVDTGYAAGANAVQARTAFAALPAVPLAGVPGLPRPLVVRTCRAGGLTWAMFLNAGMAPLTATAALGGQPSTAVDATDGAPLQVASTGEVDVPLAPWGVRVVILDDGVSINAVRATYADAVRGEVAARVAALKARRATLETPAALDVLDNPAFELGPAGAAGRPAPISGWEVLEPRRGSVDLVAGTPAEAGPSRAAHFSSVNGLATLRSNPFAPPRTGRVSVAAWLRLPPGMPQPPLRIAIEAVQGDAEYYRYAVVGGLAGGRPLTESWSQFVLQVEDVPVAGIESMRVRFDLLGPGHVEIDDVRVFDLAFDEPQRAQLTKLVSLLERDCEAGDVAACVAALEGYWPAYLERFVTDEKLRAAADRDRAGERAAAERAGNQRQAGGVLDRLRGWWQ